MKRLGVFRHGGRASATPTVTGLERVQPVHLDGPSFSPRCLDICEFSERQPSCTLVLADDHLATSSTRPRRQRLIVDLLRSEAVILAGLLVRRIDEPCGLAVEGAGGVAAVVDLPVPDRLDL